MQPDISRAMMARPIALSLAALLVALGGVPAARPALAQFGNPFDSSPPRPPASVPNNGFPAQPPPVQYPGQTYQQQPYQGQPPRQPNGIQAQPLPPPGTPRPAATTVQPARPAPGQNPGQAPGQASNPASQPAASASATPGGRSGSGAQGAAPSSDNPLPPLPPQDSVVTETPTQKIENGRAVFAGLDKITGRTINFDAAIGETVQFGALQVTARACYTRPPTEATNTDAFVEVDEVTLQGEIKRIFTGWMFASSPGLHGVEHPIYDVWLTDCSAPKVVAQSAPPPPVAPPAIGPAGAQRSRAVAPTVPGLPPRPAAPRPVQPAAPAAAPVTDD
jgi:hypothetical protein